jgi:hypothetical protein
MVQKIYQLDAFKPFEQIKAEEEEKMLKIPESNMRALFAKTYQEKKRTDVVINRLMELEEIVFRMDSRINNMVSYELERKTP